LLKSLVSNALGSHMVLQRAPAAAIIWGFATTGSEITTTFDADTPLKSIADATGTWRQLLPPTPSGGKPHVIKVESSEATVAPVLLQDVVFGEVYVCG
jgi:sialate O-acetylesterase